jgi:hypothetical protein
MHRREEALGLGLNKTTDTGFRGGTRLAGWLAGVTVRREDARGEALTGIGSCFTLLSIYPLCFSRDLSAGRCNFGCRSGQETCFDEEGEHWVAGGWWLEKRLNDA